MSQTGSKWILSRNSATNETPTWTTVKRAKNVNCPLTKEMADVSRRESGWKMEIGSLKGATIELEYVYKNSADADFLAFLDSFSAGTPIQLACTDLAIDEDNAFGFKAYFECSELPLDQPLTEGVILKLKFAHTEYEEGDTGEETLIEPAFILPEEEAPPAGP
jgi:hypothetical protein